jgi:hypothetical protein
MFFLAYIKEILLGVSAFVALYLFNRNKSLKVEKEQLKEEVQDQSKIINIQEKVLSENEKVKPATDINDAIDRLSEQDKRE